MRQGSYFLELKPAIYNHPMPSERRTGRGDGLPEVSVIVPARNEEASLGRCLESLAGQEGVSHEIVVVDDHSTDRTLEIAKSFEGLAPGLASNTGTRTWGTTVVQAGELPLGWSGKCGALVTGVAEARGEWLLFTDADTEHAPGSLARALDEARKDGAALLSYSPAQEVRGLWERALMPVVFAELACAYRPSDVCDPRSDAAAANGQYLLIRREVYDAVGGHAAVAAEILEDVALARLVKRSGRRLRFRFGGDAVRTRMYRGWAQMREGWTKNLALLFPRPGSLALKRAGEFLLAAGGLATLVGGIALRSRVAAVAGAVVAVPTWGNFLRRVRRAHFDALSTIASPLGLPVFAYLLLRSRRAWKQGRVTWKGREYGGAGDRASWRSGDLKPTSEASEGIFQGDNAGPSARPSSVPVGPRSG